MQIKLESEDITLIVQGVVEAIRPLFNKCGKGYNDIIFTVETITKNEKTGEEIRRQCKFEGDIIFTVESLAEYLQVDVSWVYKSVSTKSIPYIKIGKYTRFKKSVIDKWVETQTVRPVSHLASIRRLSQKQSLTI